MKNINKILSFYHPNSNNIFSTNSNINNLRSPSHNLNLINSNNDNTYFTNINSPDSKLSNQNNENNLKSNLKSNINNLKKRKSLKKDNNNLGQKNEKVHFFDIQNEKNKKAIMNLKQRMKYNNSKINNDDDDSIKIIDKLLNKIKEKSKEKNNILSSMKEKQEKQLEELKKEKNQISEKKLKFNIEKKIKEKEKLSHFRQSSNRNNNNQLGLGKWNYKIKKDLIPLQIYPNDEKEKDYNKNSVNDLNYLSDPIKTSKENNLISLKHNFKNRQSELPYYNSCNIVDYNNNSNSINNNSISSNYMKNSNPINKNKNELINNNKLKSRNIHKSTDRKYLDILKDDMKELSERQNSRIYSPSNSIGLKKNIKDYIMPVNDMDDVIEINYIFKSLGPAFSINSQLKK